MSKEKKKIKVAIISGEFVEEMWNFRHAIYPLVDKKDIKNVLDLLRHELEDAEDGKFTVRIKEMSEKKFKELPYLE